MKKLKTACFAIAIPLLLAATTPSMAADQTRERSQDRLRDGSCTTFTDSQVRERSRDHLRSGQSSNSLQLRTRSQSTVRTRSGSPRVR